MGTVEEQHVGRVRRLDPLLPARMPLPTAGPDDVELAAPGGAALARVVRADPATLAATWHPAERHVLMARVGADDPMAAMDGLLAGWTEAVLARARDTESSAGLTWPSRDVVLTPTFLAHGLMPTMVLAIRLAGRPSPDAGTDGSTDVVVRRTTDADLDATVALELELVRWNQMLGQMTERPNTAELIRAKHTGDGRPWSWLAPPRR